MYSPPGEGHKTPLLYSLFLWEEKYKTAIVIRARNPRRRFVTNITIPLRGEKGKIMKEERGGGFGFHLR